MYYVGIDIGSTAAKVAIINNDIVSDFVIPTGWSSSETAEAIKERLSIMGLNVYDKSNVLIASTGYGRRAVSYSDMQITEITCHGRGAVDMVGNNCTVIDIGGQDTKIVSMDNGAVSDFLMNDKCAAGTGKFVEIMANRLDLTIGELFDLAKVGHIVKISAMCTVFAESEVVNYIGIGIRREDIAAGIVESVASKVASMCSRQVMSSKVLLTGGLAGCDYLAEAISQKIKRDVISNKNGRYAGAVGAALIMKSKGELL